MAKFLNDDYEEVEAFSKEEFEKELEKAKAKWTEESASRLETLEQKLSKAEEKLSKRSDEYNNLKKVYDEGKGKLDAVETSQAEARQKLLDQQIARIAGDDKEYAEALKEQYTRFQFEPTLDLAVLETQLKDAHTLALSHLNREQTNFNFSASANAKAPEYKSNGNERFTDTEAGKQLLGLVNHTMGTGNNSDTDKGFVVEFNG